jgi:hypothetical protein
MEENGCAMTYMYELPMYIRVNLFEEMTKVRFSVLYVIYEKLSEPNAVRLAVKHYRYFNTMYLPRLYRHLMTSGHELRFKRKSNLRCTGAGTLNF